jgi:hypothetical protein
VFDVDPEIQNVTFSKIISSFGTLESGDIEENRQVLF